MPNLVLSTNFDTSTRFFANYLNDYLKRYPNPNNLADLDLCDRQQLVEIARSENEMSNIMSTINNNLPLLPIVIVEQKGDITLDFKSKIEAKFLNPIVVADINNPTNTISLRGKSTDYKGNIKLHIVTRSLISARELSFYVGELLYDSSVIKYPSFIKDIDNNTLYAKLDNFGSFKMNSNNISFSHESLNESNIFQMVTELEFRDTISLYANYLPSSNNDQLEHAEVSNLTNETPIMYQDEVNILYISESKSEPLPQATSEDLNIFKSKWNIPIDSKVMFYRELNQTFFFYNTQPIEKNTEIKQVGFREIPKRENIIIYIIEDNLTISSIIAKSITPNLLKIKKCPQ